MDPSSLWTAGRSLLHNSQLATTLPEAPTGPAVRGRGRDLPKGRGGRGGAGRGRRVVPPADARQSAASTGLSISGPGPKVGLATLGDRRELRVGKPVIYLFPPTTIEAHVQLSLVQEWEVEVAYPVVPVETIKEASDGSSRQIVEWTVEARPDGILKEKGTGLEMAYLFWEALTKPSHLATSPVVPSAAFVPGASDCSPHDSVVLSVINVPRYLDSALSALGLHIEARTSFITYWLPMILKHAHIALRFVPQGAYEESAPLSITPTPDVVTRVFMLFQRVKADELGIWSEAETRAKEDVVLWKGVVGIDDVKQQDATLFRVLEWGGMEIVRG